MATVFVIHASAETNLIKERILRFLPANCYDSWLSSSQVDANENIAAAMKAAMEQCEAILIIVSKALLRNSFLLNEIETALSIPQMTIVVQLETLPENETAALPARMWALPQVDLTSENTEDGIRMLIGLLPAVYPDQETSGPAKSERLEWNEEIFSTGLARATARHDHSRAEFLVDTIVSHIKYRPYAYPPQHAVTDLKKLKQERAFDLMCRYAEAVIGSGTNKDSVRNLYAQALIETGKYQQAIEILESIIRESGTSQSELFEARGLMGRTYKQLYVNNPKAKDAGEYLKQAVDAYKSAYVEDRKNYWHGVNAASCMLRAARDGVAAGSVEEAHAIANQIIEDLYKEKGKGPLAIWDCASMIEALLAVERYDEAQEWLDVYITHPEMRAFEVSSTYRQYEQVLELNQDPRGAAILEQLRKAMERYRTGKEVKRSSTDLSMEGKSMGSTTNKKPLIIRLSSPGWDREDITDLTIQSKMGKILTANGSEQSVRELLADPMIVSVEESRPAGKIECDRSIPFIKANGHYTSATGTFDETGDKALVAVIDNGIDILHKAFLDANGKTRIVGIWHQNDNSGAPPAGFNYGSFYDANAINGFLLPGANLPIVLRNPPVHGTHVASIAAGRAVGSFAGGVAPDAKLLIVVSASSGPIGYSQSHIDALVFIDKIATEMERPVVVNVSQGMNAGAHDGKSALEVAFDAFSESGRKAGRVVVKSAGNERDKAGHAKVTLAQGALEELKWRRVPGADDNERIELWWSSDDEIEFRLQEPGTGNWSEPVGTSKPEIKGVFASGGPYSLTFIKRHIDNGDSMLLIELGDQSKKAAAGDWLLEMRSLNMMPNGEVQCWIERTKGMPTTFLNHSNEEMTLSIPGTAQSVIAVGAVDASNPLRTGSFSSYGPTRDNQKKPQVCAPGVGVKAANSGSEDGVVSQDGTSMAAPHVTGAIALLLSRAAKSGKSLGSNQIASALRSKTQNFNGKWDRGQGFGVIDVGGLLAAFE